MARASRGLLALCLGVGGLAVADGAGADATDAPQLRLGSATVVEASVGKQVVALQVSLSEPLDHDLTITMTTRDISATAPADYRPITRPKRVILRAGKTSRSVSVTAMGDSVVEGDEQFALDVVATSDPAVAPGAAGVVTLVDSTATTPTVQFGGVTVHEGHIGKTTAKVPLTLSSPLDHDIWIDVSTTSDTATDGVDLRPVDRSVRIRAGRVAVKVAVIVFGDAEVEGDEVVPLRVDAISDAAVSAGLDALGTVTIRDDDRPPETAPGVPTGLTSATTAETRAVHLEWNPPSSDGGAPILRYRVRRTSDLDRYGLPLPEATWTTVTSTSPALSTNCALTSYGLNRCHYQVQAENIVGVSSWSEGVSASTYITRPPPK